MDDARASITALITAFVRAYHALHANGPIFDDFVAPRLFSQEERASLGTKLASILPMLSPELASRHPGEEQALACMARLQGPTLLCRARYAEESLEQAVACGAGQYVILGAGYDTFAFRRHDLLDRLRVIEVDHPATQAEKKRRLADRGLEVPPGLHFLAVDFGNQELASSLAHAPFDPEVPTFFSWLGVTYYLTHEEAHDALRAIAQIARRGSTLVFDYLEAEGLAHFGPVAQRVRGITARVGEPMKSAFDPGALGSECESLGLRLVEDLNPEAIQQRYFAGRADGYRAAPHIHLVRLEVL